MIPARFTENTTPADSAGQTAAGINGPLPLENILFDLDGTLTDSAPGIFRCIHFAVRQMGCPLPPVDSLNWTIGPPLTDIFARLLCTRDKALITRAVTLYRKRYAAKGLFENRVYAGVPACLARIRSAGGRLFLATAKPIGYARRILAHYRLEKYFQAAYGAHLDGRLSDKAELIAHILKAEHLDPARTLMVGDRHYDITGGRANRVRTGAVTYGYGNPEELEAAAPDHRFDAPADIAAFVVNGRPHNSKNPPPGHTG